MDNNIQRQLQVKKQLQKNILELNQSLQKTKHEVLYYQQANQSADIRYSSQNRIKYNAEEKKAQTKLQVSQIKYELRQLQQVQNDILGHKKSIQKKNQDFVEKEELKMNLNTLKIQESTTESKNLNKQIENLEFKEKKRQDAEKLSYFIGQQLWAIKNLEDMFILNESTEKFFKENPQFNIQDSKNIQLLKSKLQRSPRNISQSQQNDQNKFQKSPRKELQIQNENQSFQAEAPILNRSEMNKYIEDYFSKNQPYHIRFLTEKLIEIHQKLETDNSLLQNVYQNASNIKAEHQREIKKLDKELGEIKKKNQFLEKDIKQEMLNEQQQFLSPISAKNPQETSLQNIIQSNNSNNNVNINTEEDQNTKNKEKNNLFIGKKNQNTLSQQLQTNSPLKLSQNSFATQRNQGLKHSRCSLELIKEHKIIKNQNQQYNNFLNQDQSMDSGMIKKDLIFQKVSPRNNLKNIKNPDKKINSSVVNKDLVTLNIEKFENELSEMEIVKLDKQVDKQLKFMISINNFLSDLSLKLNSLICMMHYKLKLKHIPQDLLEIADKNFYAICQQQYQDVYTPQELTKEQKRSQRNQSAIKNIVGFRKSSNMLNVDEIYYSIRVQNQDRRSTNTLLYGTQQNIIQQTDDSKSNINKMNLDMIIREQKSNISLDSQDSLYLSEKNCDTVDQYLTEFQSQIQKNKIIKYLGTDELIQQYVVKIATLFEVNPVQAREIIYNSKELEAQIFQLFDKKTQISIDQMKFLLKKVNFEKQLTIDTLEDEISIYIKKHPDLPESLNFKNEFIQKSYFNAVERQKDTKYSIQNLNTQPVEKHYDPNHVIQELQINPKQDSNNNSNKLSHEEQEKQRVQAIRKFIQEISKTSQKSYQYKKQNNIKDHVEEHQKQVQENLKFHTAEDDEYLELYRDKIKQVFIDRKKEPLRLAEIEKQKQIEEEMKKNVVFHRLLKQSETPYNERENKQIKEFVGEQDILFKIDRVDKQTAKQNLNGYELRQQLIEERRQKEIQLKKCTNTSSHLYAKENNCYKQRRQQSLKQLKIMKLERFETEYLKPKENKNKYQMASTYNNFKQLNSQKSFMSQNQSEQSIQNSNLFNNNMNKSKMQKSLQQSMMQSDQYESKLTQKQKYCQQYYFYNPQTDPSMISSQQSKKNMQIQNLNNSKNLKNSEQSFYSKKSYTSQKSHQKSYSHINLKSLLNDQTKLIETMSQNQNFTSHQRNKTEIIKLHKSSDNQSDLLCKTDQIQEFQFQTNNSRPGTQQQKNKKNLFYRPGTSQFTSPGSTYYNKTTHQHSRMSSIDGNDNIKIQNIQNK